MKHVAMLAAIGAGKLTRLLTQQFGLGGGTNLPGRVARALSPTILYELTRQLPHGVILFSGTNGKTTTTRMLSDMLRAHGWRVLHNRAGANLVTGVTATALAGGTLTGAPRHDIALFETDEAALPQVLRETQPRLVIIHNLFRDQLDRYGEVDTLARAWHAALVHVPASTCILLNADDPAVAHLGTGLHAQVRYYGLEDVAHAATTESHIADSIFCRVCGERYVYEYLFYSHIGHYRCPECQHERPTPDIQLVRLRLHGTKGSTLLIRYPGGACEIQMPLPGLYNALNGLAAAAAGLMMGVSPQHVRNSLEHFRAAFGRIERLSAGEGGAPMLIALIKNPVGASETVRMLTETTATTEPLFLLIAINDRYADGTDVSWLWDATFEPLAEHAAQITVSGTRAHDMAVRLKYGGVAEKTMAIEADLARALDVALGHLPDGATLAILPTYTAVLELRDILVQRGWVQPFWEE